MKLLITILLFMYSASASVRVLELYYITDDEIKKSAGLTGYDFKVTSLCKDNHKYTIIKIFNGAVSITQDFEKLEFGNSLVPIRCNSEK